MVKERLAIRADDPDAVSDGNWEIYLTQKERFQALTEEEQAIIVDTDAPLDALIAEVNKKLYR